MQASTDPPHCLEGKMRGLCEGATHTFSTHPPRHIPGQCLDTQTFHYFKGFLANY